MPASAFSALYSRQGEARLASELVHDDRWRQVGELPLPFHMAVAPSSRRRGMGGAPSPSTGLVSRRAPADPASLRALVRSAEILRAAGDVKGAREAYARPAPTPRAATPGRR